MEDDFHHDSEGRREGHSRGLQVEARLGAHPRGPRERRGNLSPAHEPARVRPEDALEAVHDPGRDRICVPRGEDGRRRHADDRRADRHPAALCRTEAGSGGSAGPARTDVSRPAPAEDLRRSCRRGENDSKTAVLPPKLTLHKGRIVPLRALLRHRRGRFARNGRGEQNDHISWFPDRTSEACSRRRSRSISTPPCAGSLRATWDASS